MLKYKNTDRLMLLTFCHWVNSINCSEKGLQKSIIFLMTCTVFALEEPSFNRKRSSSRTRLSIRVSACALVLIAYAQKSPMYPCWQMLNRKFHTVNFTPCVGLIPIRHFWQMWNLRMVNFDNFWGVNFC